MILEFLQNHTWFTQYEWVHRLIYTFIVILIAFIIIFVIKKIIKLIINKKKGKNRRADTLTKLIGNCISYIVTFIALIQVLNIGLNIDVTSVLAAAGILGLAVGFGAQTLVKDVITGFFILFENQYHVGERVRISDFEGRVEELGLRTTTVRAENDGRLLFIPNGSINKVINFSRKKEN